MGHIRDTFHIDAPLEVCWDIGTDAGRQPEWSEGARSGGATEGPGPRPEGRRPARTTSRMPTLHPES